MNAILDNYKFNLMEANDDRLFFDLIERNRSRLEDFFAGTVSKTRTLEDTLEYCKEIQTRISDKSYFPFLIKEIMSNKVVGFFDIKNIQWDIPKAELGCFIDSEFEGLGIPSALMVPFVDHIQTSYNFKKLYCRVATINKRSKAVIVKSGFELEGVIKSDYKTTRGEIVDLEYYGRVFG